MNTEHLIPGKESIDLKTVSRTTKLGKRLLDSRKDYKRLPREQIAHLIENRKKRIKKSNPEEKAFQEYLLRILELYATDQADYPEQDSILPLLSAIEETHREIKNLLGTDNFTMLTPIQQQGAQNMIAGKLHDTVQIIEAQKQSSEDALTKLPNRRAFMFFAEKAIAHVKRTNEPLSIIMIDFDKFKEVNDTYGHAAGDEALIQRAQLFQGILRPSDIICRVGGEEFAVICPNTNEDGAKILCERIRNITANKPITIHNQQHQEITLQKTVSLGIHCYEKNIQEESNQQILTRLMQQSDNALYQAKESGRNRIGLSTANGTIEIFPKEPKPRLSQETIAA